MRFKDYINGANWLLGDPDVKKVNETFERTDIEVPDFNSKEILKPEDLKTFEKNVDTNIASGLAYALRVKYEDECPINQEKRKQSLQEYLETYQTSEVWENDI